MKGANSCRSGSRQRMSGLNRAKGYSVEQNPYFQILSAFPATNTSLPSPANADTGGAIAIRKERCNSGSEFAVIVACLLPSATPKICDFYAQG
jgi:hypothetical protein